MISAGDYSALLTTVKLASVSTAFLLLLSIPLAWWLTRTQWRFKFVVEALIALPLVLPPTVLGFYLLIMFNPSGFLGSSFTALTGSNLAFSFSGLVIGSILYSLPFVVQPLQNSFESIDRDILETASTLGANSVDRLVSVVLPIAFPGLVTASVLGFAHTLGEFGVVLMIGGNIPGETKVASIAIYEHVESLNYTEAHTLSALLLGMSLVLLMLVYATGQRVLRR